jgi:hypothetical protein
MLYPDVGRAPQPNPDLPEPVKVLYLEAASISTKCQGSGKPSHSDRVQNQPH